MRPSIVFAGMLVNTLLLVGIIYLNYFAPRPGVIARQHHDQVTKPERTVALIVPSQGRGTDEIIQAFAQTLEREASFTPLIKVYNANANRTLMRSNIEAAIAAKVDILVPIGSQAAQMAKELTEKRERRIPIVFAGTGDPVRLELVDSVECSGNHLTGVCAVGLEWIAQIVALLPVLTPHVKRIFIPYDPTGLGGALEQYKQRFDVELEKAGYQVSSVALGSVGEISEKVTPFMADTDMVLVLPDAVMFDGMTHVAKLCREHQVPVFTAQNMAMLKKGSTFAFGYHVADIGVGAARYVERILTNGELPTHMPIDSLQAAYRVGVNVNTARHHGVYDKMNQAVVYLMANGEVV